MLLKWSFSTYLFYLNNNFLALYKHLSRYVSFVCDKNHKFFVFPSDLWKHEQDVNILYKRFRSS